MTAAGDEAGGDAGDDDAHAVATTYPSTMWETPSLHGSLTRHYIHMPMQSWHHLVRPPFAAAALASRSEVRSSWLAQRVDASVGGKVAKESVAGSGSPLRSPPARSHVQSASRRLDDSTSPNQRVSR